MVQLFEWILFDIVPILEDNDEAMRSAYLSSILDIMYGTFCSDTFFGANFGLTNEFVGRLFDMLFNKSIAQEDRTKVRYCR